LEFRLQAGVRVFRHSRLPACRPGAGRRFGLFGPA